MFTGCGIDIEETARFERFISPYCKEVNSLIYDVFSGREILNYCGATALQRFTAGYCCKEAFIKALGGGENTADIDLRDIELIFASDDLSKFSVELSGSAHNIIQERNLMLSETSLESSNEYIIFKIVINDIR